MAKSLMKVHKDVQRESIKREVMKKVEDRLITDITMGMKAVFLLALKKEGWGQKRAIRLFYEVEAIEKALRDELITWEEIYDQVEEEYKIRLEIERL